MAEVTVVEERAEQVGSRSFEVTADKVVQHLELQGRMHTSSIEVPAATGDPLGDWWTAQLRGATPTSTEDLGTARTMELFSGPGGLAVGFGAAAAQLGFKVRSRVAVDQDAGALAVYRANHGTERTSDQSVAMLVDYHVRGARQRARFHYPPELIEPGWSHLVGNVDVVLAGPPCQGHSNLNNHSRRSDPRNELYLTVPAMAIAVEAPVVVIENVPAVVHDELGVVETTITLLKDAGYTVTTGVLDASKLGWAQRRSRFFLVARRDRPPVPLEEVADVLQDSARPLWWAIEDLEDALDDGFMTVLPEMNEDNRNRIAWLHDNDAYDLALSERPDCHKDGTTYMSVYGRLHEEEPAPTITTGFMTPGRGRYVHPTRRRVITPREAARLQGFPDTYDFAAGSEEPPTRAKLAKWIGDAVPMPLGHAASIAALAPGPVGA